MLISFLGMFKSDCVCGSPSSPSPLRPTDTFVQVNLAQTRARRPSVLCLFSKHVLGARSVRCWQAHALTPSFWLAPASSLCPQHSVVSGLAVPGMAGRALRNPAYVSCFPISLQSSATYMPNFSSPWMWLRF